MSATTEQEATQRPAFASMADALDAQDPELQGSAVESTEGGTPAAGDVGEPVAPAEGGTTAQPQEIDYKAEYDKLHQQITSEAGRELSAAGRLKQANAENARLKAERDDFERRVNDQNARIDKWWEEAIASSTTEEEKAEYRRLHAIDQRERAVAQKEQTADLERQQVERRQGELRQQAEGAARNLAIAEVDAAIDARAKYEGLPPHIFQEVKNYIASPFMQKLAEVLPLRGERQLSGDPASWDVRQIPDLDHLHQYAMALAENGYAHFKRQHEEARVQQNAAQAQQTYQPERVAGAGVSPQTRDLSKYRNSGNIAAVLDIEDGLDPDE